MTISEAVEAYIAHKEQQGTAFGKGRLLLAALSKNLDNKLLHQVSCSDVAQFLGEPNGAVTFWRNRHFILKNFIAYWSFREKMLCVELPPLPIPVRSSYVPHIFSRDEIRRLSQAALSKAPSNNEVLDGPTKRLVILGLYATGAYINQLLALQWTDADLKLGELTLRGGRFKRARTIPINLDFTRLLIRHRGRITCSTGYIFTDRRGDPIQTHQITQAFKRLRSVARIVRNDPAAPAPRLHDMRSTFAVNRLEEGFKRKVDMNILLPALAAYMGLTGLLNSERYMDLVPSRFGKELGVLSTATRRKRWRDDPELMRFLSAV